MVLSSDGYDSSFKDILIKTFTNSYLLDVNKIHAITHRSLL